MPAYSNTSSSTSGVSECEAFDELRQQTGSSKTSYARACAEEKDVIQNVPPARRKSKKQFAVRRARVVFCLWGIELNLQTW